MINSNEKIWEKPVLYEETFQLDQHIATGCTNTNYITVTPGGSLTFTGGCASSYPGQGHWHYEGVIYDTDGDGIIDEDEWKEAMDRMADNGNETGHGHYKNHTTTVTIDGQEYEDYTGLFTS